MATAPKPQLPMFYNDLLPISSKEHKTWKVGTFDNADFLAETHAFPLTADEFVDAQRDYPIVFTAGDNPVPLALMGLNEGVNTFIDDNGKLAADVYVPAYVRRYPFLLVKMKPDSEELSLCFDPTAGVVGEMEEGNALFDENGEATQYTNNVLGFCTNFEQAGQRTKALIDKLNEYDLMMDGEIAITRNDLPDNPFVYRGFRMVDEKKLRELSNEKLHDLHESGILMLIHAHLFSLNLMRRIFERQHAQGKIATPELDGAAAPKAN